MTSIIKVDQIQTAAGGVPTASDLGLAALTHTDMPAGVILNVWKFKSSQPASTVVSSAASLLYDSLNVTVQQGSRLMTYFHTGQYIKSSPNTNPNFYMQINGADNGMTVASGGAQEYDHIWYGQNAAREGQNGIFLSDALDAGTRTLQFYISVYNGSCTMSYQSPTRGPQYIVMEIAG